MSIINREKLMSYIADLQLSSAPDERDSKEVQEEMQSRYQMFDEFFNIVKEFKGCELTEHEEETQKRCEAALDKLKHYSLFEGISKDDYLEFATLIGLLPQLQQDRNRAMEKEEPKRPDVEGDGYSNGQMVYDTWICPRCGSHYEIEYDDYNYCPNCGQHIQKPEMEGE